VSGDPLAGLDVAALRERAFAAWAERLDPWPEGWAAAALDLRPLLAVFGLGLADGYDLVVFTYREGRDGEGRVYAVPERAARQHHDPPDPPEDALDEVGAALAGDGSPASYFLASLALRELGEVGALGHGRAWSDEDVVLDDLPEADWQWREPPPATLAPQVEVVGDDVTVRFVTHSARGGHRLTEHVDRYRAGSYVPRHEQRELARAAGGYVP
jgi:hypothetical protein